MRNSLMLAGAALALLAGCGGGGSDAGPTADGAASKPGAGSVLAPSPAPDTSGPVPAPPVGQGPAQPPVSGGTPPPSGAQPPDSSDPAPVAGAPDPGEGARPPVAQPTPAPTPPAPTIPGPVATPTSGVWAVTCRRYHGDGGLTRGYVTRAGLFSVDDATIDLTGQPLQQFGPTATQDVHNPEVSSWHQQSYGTQTLLFGVGEDTRPRAVQMVDAGQPVRQWECSVTMHAMPPGMTAGLCYISKDPLTKGLGPPVPVGVDWQAGVILRHADTTGTRYAIGSGIRAANLPFVGQADDGTNLQCW